MSATRRGVARSTVRVLVADGHPLFRDALVRAMRRERSIELAHVTDRWADSLVVQRHRPHVVVVDRDLFALDLAGAAAVAALGVPLLMLATEVDPRDVYLAIEEGVAGYVSKDASAETLCEAVFALARGETRLDGAAQTVIAGEIRLRARDGRPQLSPREQQILELISAGCTAPQAAAALHISTATVKTHLLHLYEKLGVAERAAAVAEGMRHGLIE